MGTLSSLLGCSDPDEQQCRQLADWVAEQMKQTKGNFASVLQVVRGLIDNQDDKSTAVQCLLKCLTWCYHEGTTAAAQHLLLEAVPSTPAATSQHKQRAVELMLLYCSSNTCKLASKVATTFRLARNDLSLEDWQQLCACVPVMLQQPSNYKAAVHLMMQFEGLDEVVDRVDVLSQLVAERQDSLAQHWATSLGRDYQVAFVEGCVTLDRLKPAARAVRQLHLAAEFPNIEGLYRQRSLSRLMSKRLWPVALSYVGNDAALQTQLVQGMAEVGEQALAEEYRKQLGLPQDTLAPPDPAAIAAQEAARREAYLQLELPQGCLLWVDDSSGCDRATLALAGSREVGLDVEWKPSHTAGVSSPAALLQVANATHVVLFDLITLAQHHPAALDACLGPLLSDPAVLKLGFELAGDLSKLSGSWPGCTCFRSVDGVLDLRPLWVAYGLAARHQGGSARALSAVGLSTLCQNLLGKPLDKSQQMSDWSARPLTDRQQQYAALDAFVLVQLFGVLTDRLGPDTTQQLVQQHTKTINRPLPSSTGSNGRSKSPGSSGRPGSPTSTGPSPIAAASASATASAAAAASGQGSRSSSRSTTPGTASRPVGLGADADAGPSIHSGSSSRECAAPSPAGEGRVISLLQQHGLQGRIQQLNPDTFKGSPHITAWDTAAAVGASISCVAKTTVCLVDQQPHIVVTRGDQRIDMHKLSALLGVKRRSIVIAPQSTVTQLTGFKTGVPPIGFNDTVRVVLDRRLTGFAPATAPPAAAPPSPQPAAAAVRGAPFPTDPDPSHTALVNARHLPDTGSEVVTSLPGIAGRGLGVVAAATVANAQPAAAAMEPATQQGQTTAHTQQGEKAAHKPAADDTPLPPYLASSSSASPPAHASGSSSSSTGATSLLAVQCGPGAVLQLSFQELRQLCGQQSDVADVADAPAEAAGVSTMTGVAAAAAGGTQAGTQGHGTPKFLLDSMLGRLCRWLRALGIDTEFVEPGQQGQGQQGPSMLVQQIQEAALLQGRLFVTRDQKLAMRRDVGGSVYLLGSNDAADQLEELKRHFGIKLDESMLMSRCGTCNAADYHRISHEEAAAHVSNSKLLELVDEFWQCGKCGKCVWMGPKSYAAINLLEGLFTDGEARPTPLQSLQRPA